MSEDAIKAHRKKLRAVWNSKTWKDAKKSFLRNNPACAWCGKPATVPHHPTLDTYGTPDYLGRYLSDCVPLCNKCHFCLHKGLKLCPSCRGRYTAVLNDFCSRCDPEYQQRIEDALKRKQERLKRQREYRQKKYQELKAEYTNSKQPKSSDKK